MAADKPDFVNVLKGALKGHVKEAREHFKADERQRAAAEAAPKSIILTQQEVQSGVWDADKVLQTTLGGRRRDITADDLAAFRHNMRMAQKRFDIGKDGKPQQGITARQVIDLATSAPLSYVHGGSDIKKAKNEIRYAFLASVRNDTLRFITDASGEHGALRHTVIVRLNAFREAVLKLSATKMDDAAAPRQIANWLRKQKLAFDCDCGRHRYFFRYVATIGGFAAGREEWGYPKIRNPGLKGCACKHVLRALTELESSRAVLSYLEKHLSRVRASGKHQASSQAKKAELTKKTASKIKTSAERKAEALRAKERRELKRAASGQRPAAARRVNKQKQSAAETLLAELKTRGVQNLSAQDLARMMEKAGIRLPP
jgi:hypothetical protein